MTLRRTRTRRWRGPIEITGPDPVTAARAELEAATEALRLARHQRDDADDLRIAYANRPAYREAAEAATGAWLLVLDRAQLAETRLAAALAATSQEQETTRS